MNDHDLILPTDQLSEVISRDIDLLPVIARFGVCAGIGQLTISEVCRSRGIDPGFFLAVLNTYHTSDYFPDIESIDLVLLTNFLTETHLYHKRVTIPMLLQLMQAGVLARQQAVVLGDFSAYTITAADNGYEFDAMVAYLRAALPCPVLTGLEFGHGRRRVTIPVGTRAHLQSDGSQFTLTFSDYPSLGHVEQHA